MSNEPRIELPTVDAPSACCCGGPAAPEPPPRSDADWTAGVVGTPAGEVTRVRTTWTGRDRRGALAARLGIGRMRYTVAPGLYAVGQPDRDAPVLVSANYKLSFDHLRRALAGRDAWILVLDTKGINVWCAAGKGTFGTDELVRRVQRAALDRVVAHRRLIVPQLGAPGVSAHEVKARCGFRVEYGPIRAADLPAFFDARLRATPEMRRVRFGLRERAVLIPVELVGGGKLALLVAAIFLLVGGLGPGASYSLAAVRGAGLVAAAAILAAFVTGAALGPLLLPWLPGRAFALKGAALGLALGLALVGSGALGPLVRLGSAAWILLLPAVSSFVLMNFTGASTFTSLSGVRAEMRVAVPAQAAAALVGCGLWVAGLLVDGGVLR